MRAQSALGRALVATLTSAGAAAGAEGRAPTPTTASAGPEGRCPDTDPGDRRHDGFFARSETGLSLLWADVSGAASRTGIRAIGQSATLSFGGTPARGLVLGGSLWTARLDPVFVESGRTVTPDDDSVKLTMLRVGPFVDYYPDPTAGFHAQGAAQLAVQIESDVKGNPIEPTALGAAASMGAGYEWFLSGEFSLGFVARAALGRVVRAPNGGEERMLWVIPELALTATYH